VSGLPEPSVAQIVSPRRLAARNALRRGWRRPAVLSVLTALFWVGCFALFARALEWFHTIGDFGPLLTERLLVLLFVTFFAILLLSNTITALTTFYLADDVNLLLAAPIEPRVLHHARFLETLVSSSWMVLLFGMPIFLAYGVVERGGPLFYGGTVAALLPFLVIPAAIGTIVATMLVLVFPAQRARDGLLLLIGLSVGAAFVLVRLARPERLADPSGLAGFASFLVGFGGEPSPWLPTTWITGAMLPLLGAREGDPAFSLGLLWTTAAALFLSSAALVERTYLRAWTKAQEGGRRPGHGGSLLERIERMAGFLPRVPRLLLAKDLSIFLRDASQWSQLVLIGALVVIYVYNFTALPIAENTPLGIVLRDVATFFNLGLAAFVVTSVAVRFVFPTISLEGRSWWILRTAPVSLDRLWWSKFWIGFGPLVVLGEILVVLTNHLLGVNPLATAVFAATLVPLVAAIVAMGLGFGASYPRLDTQNAAQIATGFGAIVYMVSALGLVAAVVLFEAWPISRLLGFGRGAPASLAAKAGYALLAFAAALAPCAWAFVAARRRGIRALERLGS